MVVSKRVRGRQIRLPAWWVEEANRASEGKSLHVLAAELTDVAGRKDSNGKRVPWSHTAVSHFLKNESATVEMAEAFCLLYDGLPPPVFMPRSLQEATQMLVVARRFDPEHGGRGRVVNTNTPPGKKKTRVIPGVGDVAGADPLEGLATTKEPERAARRPPRGMAANQR